VTPAWNSARDLLEPVARRRPDDDRIVAALGFVYAGLGRVADATRSVDAILPASDGNVFGRPRTIETAARILAQAGLVEQAVAQLDRLLSANSPVSVHTLELDPLYDPVRNSPAFRRLIETHASRSRPGSSPR
jgi:predicted Zn-dependent protease